MTRNQTMQAMNMLASAGLAGQPPEERILSGSLPENRPLGRRDAARPSPLKFANILVPIDFSRISRTALDYAVPLARQFGAKITLVHAIEPLPYTVDLTYDPMGEGLRTKSATTELNALAKSVIEPQFLREVVVRAGTAFEAIANAARDCKADLIVITTHGHTGFKHVFMGSTAERVVRHAPCPVLVVRKCEHGLI